MFPTVIGSPARCFILLLALCAERGVPAELDEANQVNLVNYFPPAA
jgi:hypothetical protein